MTPDQLTALTAKRALHSAAVRRGRTGTWAEWSDAREAWHEAQRALTPIEVLAVVRAWGQEHLERAGVVPAGCVPRECPYGRAE